MGIYWVLGGFSLTLTNLYIYDTILKLNYINVLGGTYEFFSQNK